LYDGQMQFGVNVKVVRSDNGKEFTLGPTKKFYAYHGMLH